jgi:hypothetical protein
MDITIELTFSDFRTRIRELRRFVASDTGIPEEKIKLRTSLNNEWGVDGQDSWDLLENFAEKYDALGDNFDLTTYFSSTEPPTDAFASVFIDGPFNLFIFLFLRPFSYDRWYKLYHRNDRKDFTFGDLVTWSFTKVFHPKKTVQFSFKKAGSNGNGT